MARHEIWIIADNDSADKMLKFHQLKNLSMTDEETAKWYIFAAFDTFTQTAKSIGNAFQQLECGLLKSLEERPRPPHSIIFLLGDSFMNDNKLCLNTSNLEAVLYAMLKQLKRVVWTYIDSIPNKAKPTNDVRLYVLKPLPKPERFFKGKGQLLALFAKRRHVYNNKLINVLHELGMQFINAGINQSDGHAFIKIPAKQHGSSRDKFILSPHGLNIYWRTISESLAKLHRVTQDDISFAASTSTLSHVNPRQYRNTNPQEEIDEYFTSQGHQPDAKMNRKRHWYNNNNRPVSANRGGKHFRHFP